MNMNNLLIKVIPVSLLMLFSGAALAAEGMANEAASQATQHLDLTNHWVGFLSIGILYWPTYLLWQKSLRILENLNLLF